MSKSISDKQLKRLLYPDGRAQDVYRKISYPLVKLILPYNIHPDFIHLCRLLFCIAGAALFVTGNYFLIVLGALLFQLNILFDTFDGALARHQGKASVKGEYQDVALDHLTSSVLYFASAAGFAYVSTQHTLYLWIGAATILLAQVAAFLRAMYTEYNVSVRKAQEENMLVRLAHQDNSRFFALVLLITAIFSIPAITTVLFFAFVIAKTLILSIHIYVSSGKNPLSPWHFYRYVLLILFICSVLADTVLGTNTKKYRRTMTKSKRRSVIEKQITARFA